MPKLEGYSTPSSPLIRVTTFCIWNGSRKSESIFYENMSGCNVASTQNTKCVRRNMTAGDVYVFDDVFNKFPVLKVTVLDIRRMANQRYSGTSVTRGRLDLNYESDHSYMPRNLFHYLHNLHSHMQIITAEEKVQSLMK